jgi:hypothetical protein
MPTRPGGLGPPSDTSNPRSLECVESPCQPPATEVPDNKSSYNLQLCFKADQAGGGSSVEDFWKDRKKAYRVSIFGFFTETGAKVSKKHSLRHARLSLPIFPI